MQDTHVSDHYDVSVELLRSIASFIVICCHVNMNLSGLYSSGSYCGTFISVVVGDGVAVFWLITGFFYFNKKNYTGYLKNTFKKIALPLLIYTLICLFPECLFSGIPVAQLIAGFVKNILIWEAPAGSYTGHLWFLYTYLWVAAIFPVLFLIKQKFYVNPKFEKILMITFFGLLLLNDITLNKLFEFLPYSINVLLPAIIEIFFGYELYKHRDFIKNNKSVVWFGLFIFIIVNIIRAAVQYTVSDSEPSNWYTAYSALCAVGLSAFVIRVGDHIPGKFYPAVRFVGSCTLYIYIIHSCVTVLFVNKFKIGDFVANILSDASHPTILYVALLLVISLLIFTVSLALSAPLKTLHTKLIKISNRN